MPVGFPFPRRSGQQLDEPLLDMILNGRPLPADAPQSMLALADRLASLGRPAGPGEVPGEVAAMAAFSRSVAGPASRPPETNQPTASGPAALPPGGGPLVRPGWPAGSSW